MKIIKLLLVLFLILSLTQCQDQSEQKIDSFKKEKKVLKSRQEKKIPLSEQEITQSEQNSSEETEINNQTEQEEEELIENSQNQEQNQISSQEELSSEETVEEIEADQDQNDSDKALLKLKQMQKGIKKPKSLDILNEKHEKEEDDQSSLEQDLNSEEIVEENEDDQEQNDQDETLLELNKILKGIKKPKGLDTFNEEHENKEEEEEEDDDEDDEEGQSQEENQLDDGENKVIGNLECYDLEDCPGLHNCIDNKCVHKDLFPLTLQEIVGLMFLLLLVGFAQAGGIGGGPILMPILLGILNYDTKQAIALSFVLIFGGSCGNFMNNSGNQTKFKTPVIWYDLVLMSLPQLMGGAIFGVAINHFLPNSVIVVILVYILYGSATKTYKKYKSMTAEENNRQQSQNIPLVDVNSNDFGQTPYKKSDISPELEQIYAEDREQYPKIKFLKMGFILAVIVILSLAKGGKGVDSFVGISPCGLGYWAVNFVIIIVCLFISRRFTLEMLNFEQRKIQHGFDFKKYGDKFDEEKAADTSKAALFAGFVGGLLGLGGGVVLTPKWLDMGIPSDRTTATATFTVCFTSFISFFTNFLAGKYAFSEVVFFYVISFVASFLVSRFLKYLTDKYQKQSLIIGVLLGVITMALVLLPIIQVFNMIEDPTQLYTFGQLC